MAKQQPRRAPNRIPQVTVLVDTSTDWGRQTISGILHYAQKHGPWHMSVEPRGRSDPMHLPSDWDGDGIIARISTTKLASELRCRNVPVVNISGIELEGIQFPRVSTDYGATAELAAEHFRTRGFRRFAYVGPLDLTYVTQHAAEFERRTANDNLPLKQFNYAHESMASQRWRRQRQRLEKWLAELEKPIAIFCWGTAASCQLLDVCRGQQIIVPDQVAVLAGDNDDLIAQATVPPMSAILNPCPQIGFRAAERLEELMSGGYDNGKPMQIAPIEVVTRGSTDILAIEDEELYAAVRFIRENAFGELTVEQVARSVPMARRALERKFVESFGRSPLSEIRRLRIARVKQLLATTDLSISKVADASGFGTPEYMTSVFKKETQLTPLRYRSKTRAR
ncbi:AraC family transcriptional regulator [Rhodopirellula sallentina]|nr:DNA-binding transcriptional regulator [Rhodopirellula sallentina]